MDKTKIDWCDSTWNPVTGCLHGCEYCYARSIANRFSPFDLPHLTDDGVFKGINDLEKPIITECKDGKERICAYPYGFEPTLHRYRLNEYQNKKGRNIFVCSMADLFGEWVPDEWIEEVFKACEKAPQHNYLFLTKNPIRYEVLHQRGILVKTENMWYGYSVTNEDYDYWYDSQYHTFASIEPILEPVQTIPPAGWVIIGAETGRRKDNVVPKREWIGDIVKGCRHADIPVFMKSSLADIWGEPLIQEFPEELKKYGISDNH